MSTHSTGSAASMISSTAIVNRCSQCGMLVPHYSTSFWSGHDGPFCESCWKARNSNKHATLTELDTIARLQEENDALNARVSRLTETLEHIIEYWNRDENDKAMSDALWHIIDAATSALEDKR